MLKRIATYSPNIRVYKVDESIVKPDNIQKQFSNIKDGFTFSHFINGRWENIYVHLSDVPDIGPLLLSAAREAGLQFDKKLIIPNRLLGLKDDAFWFNVAEPGQSTGWHDHHQYADASGVYYVNIPNDSGNIFFKQLDGTELEIESRTGNLILFPSKLKHRVGKNFSSEKRISLAFNLFTLPLKQISSQNWHDESSGLKRYY